LPLANSPTSLLGECRKREELFIFAGAQLHGLKDLHKAASPCIHSDGSRSEYASLLGFLHKGNQSQVAGVFSWPKLDLNFLRQGLPLFDRADFANSSHHRNVL